MSSSSTAEGTSERASADVIVVGGGGAALAAAAEVARLGCRVLVIEKNPVLGGSTRLSTGLVMGVGSSLQASAGVADSPDVYDAEAAEIIRTQGLTDDPAMRRLLTENSAETVNFLASIGVNFFGPLAFPPFTVKRFHQALPDGRTLVRCLEAHCRSLGVEFRLQAQARQLLTHNGRVTAVEVWSRDGGTQRLFAGTAVILATGDFSANRELRSRYGERDLESLEAYNETATGDGHSMALEIGATIESMGSCGIPLGTIALPHAGRKREPSRLPTHGLITRLMSWALRWLPKQALRLFVLRRALTDLPLEPTVFKEGAILVNRAGKRFVDELRMTAADVASQPGGEAFVVFDNKIARLFNSSPYYLSRVPGAARAYVDDYRTVRGDAFYEALTIAELAARAGIAGDALNAAVTSRNLALSRADKALTNPPFFALGPFWACVRHIPIGVEVNTGLQVLRKTGVPIPGLYAAGDVGHGGFVEIGHGHALSWAFTTGRLAGRYAARERGASGDQPS